MITTILLAALAWWIVGTVCALFVCWWDVHEVTIADVIMACLLGWVGFLMVFVVLLTVLGDAAEHIMYHWDSKKNIVLFKGRTNK